MIFFFFCLYPVTVCNQNHVVTFQMLMLPERTTPQGDLLLFSVDVSSKMDVPNEMDSSTLSASIGDQPPSTCTQEISPSGS